MDTKYSNIKILVIGDSCKDVFIYGKVHRLAPEAPVPIFNPEYSVENGGMALNVKNNLLSLGCECDIITNHEKTVKKRYVDDRSNTLLIRIDENDNSARIENKITTSLKNNIFRGKKYDAIIISDYCKGFLEEEDIKLISENNYNIFLDTKKILGSWCKKVSFIKINYPEYKRTLHTINEHDINDKMIITRSDEGCEYLGVLYPVEKVVAKDLSGAGDTFMSGFVAEYILTKDIEKSINFAQNCAKQVVQKKGVCSIDYNEL